MEHPDLNLLLALDVLLEEGSVVGAARRMNLSPPAMSRTLGRIRETLGDPVFVQAGRKLVPTPRALAMREQVRVAVEHATLALAPASESDLKTLDRRFNVRANDVFVGIHAGRLLEAMTRDMPRAMLRFSPEEDDVDVDALRSGRIDLLSVRRAHSGRKSACSRCSRPLSWASLAKIIRFSTTTSPPKGSPVGGTSASRAGANRRGRSTPPWRRRACAATSP